MKTLTRRQCKYFADRLRGARHQTLCNAESFVSIVQAFEELGAHLLPGQFALGKYVRTLTELAQQSPLYAGNEPPLAGDIAFERLCHVVREGRNDAVHEGAHARHLSLSASNLAIVLEDALQHNMFTVSDFAVQSPICAEMWYPLRTIRQKMLVHSFSFLPVHTDAGWKLVGDMNLATYLRPSDHKQRKVRLNCTLEEAAKTQQLKLSDPVLLSPQTAISDAAACISACPGLVLESERLVGIITAFDLL